MNLHCQQCHQNPSVLNDTEQSEWLNAIPGWVVEGGVLMKTFCFEGYEQAMAFANLVALIAQAQDHHPEMTISYKDCVVRYRTHQPAGITMNDFICAARIEKAHG